MRKAFIILTGMLFTLLFASCNQFTANIDDYLSYWASEAYITDSSIKAVLQNDLNSIPSVPSAEDVSVTFKLKNPKSFSLDLPPAADPAKKVIVFEHLTQAPVVGTDYTLTQSEDRQSLTLTYKASFLQAYEWGAQDLSSTLSLYAVDGRPFKQTYTLKLKANTPPQNPSFTVAKTTGSPAYYVLCITIPDMDKRVPGGLLHKDLARIEVNGTPYTFSVNEAKTAFTKPEADVFITHSDVEKLNEPDADDVPADSSWVLYYKTDVEVKDGAAKKDYTIKLIDKKGLASGIVNASTKPNKAETEIVRITKGTKISGNGDSESDPTIIGTDSSGATLSVSSATGNTTVHCTLTEIGGSTPVKYDGNPVTVPLPLNGAGEKKYKLEYYTDGEGLAATPVQTVYYKVVQGHTVSFDANTGAYPDGTTAVSKHVLHGATVSAPDPLPKKQGFGVTDWYKDKDCSAGKKWEFASDTVTGNITLYAQWTAGNSTYTVKHYKQNINDDNYTLAETETKPGTTDASISADSIKKNYEGFEYDHIDSTTPTIVADGSTVVKVYYKRKTYAVNFNVDGPGGSIAVTAVTGGSLLSGNPVTVKHGGSVTFTAVPADNSYEVDRWSTNVGNISSDKTQATLSNVTGNGITVTVKFKKKIYTVTYLVEIVDGEAGGKIKADSGNFVENGSTSVEYGGSVGFTAVPTNTDWKVAEWKKDNTVVNGTNSTYTLSNITENKEVTVKFYQSHISSPETWKDLLRAVKSAPDNSTITINGEIKATNDEGNKGIINIRKRLTIKGNNPSAALNADSKSGIFDVFNTLTLENITLTKGAAFYYQSGGAGVYVNPSGTLIMEGSSVITDCSAANSGGGVYVGGGTFEMHGTSAITGCTASKGGGVYVSGGTFKMQDSAIVTPSTGSEQYTAGKNDVYLESGKMITINGTLTGTTPVARITVPNTAYNTSTQVLADAITTGSPQNYTKFTVTPQDVVDGKMFWYITDAGKLKAEVEDLQTLKEAVQAAPADNTPFVIKLAGTIDDLQTVQIPNGKKIMLKADNASKPAILKCPDNGHGQALYTYFEVQSGASLTLEGLITLQGVDSGYRKIHHALSVNHNGNAEIKNGVTITGFKNSWVNSGGEHAGNGPVFVNGTLTMSGGTIEKNTVDNLNGSLWSGGGGGVYVGETGKFIMKGGTITQNEVSGYNPSVGGGGVYVDGSYNGGDPIRGQFTMEGGTIEKNTGYEGGGVLVKGIFEMKGGKITENNSNNGKGVRVYHQFDWYGGEITTNYGFGNAVVGPCNNQSGNTAS
ncbi:InlB B-repeat-containing protein [Treponema sp. OMZ 805]|uniref:InlB B-repeat-containing protein n=1 Tax=Treponema sp. OMZ 805 TaxID=2726068 RepID=UPI003D92028A